MAPSLQAIGPLCRLGSPSMPRSPSRLPAGAAMLVAIAAGTLVALVAGCGTTGRALRPPPAGATAPTVATTASAAINTVAPTATLFVLSSPVFTPGESIPSTYTCDGAGTSPPLNWTDVPAGTVELVLVIADPDANGFVHWMVSGINPSVTGLAAGATPPGAVVLANSSGTHAYAPLCPPAGQVHSYEMTLYALARPSGLTAASDTAKAITQIAAQSSGTAAVLTGDYQRAKSK